MQDPAAPELLSTGIAGLDTILGAGLTPNRIDLVGGEPGAGKTTAGLPFPIDRGLLTGVPAVLVPQDATA